MALSTAAPTLSSSLPTVIRTDKTMPPFRKLLQTHVLGLAFQFQLLYKQVLALKALN